MSLYSQSLEQLVITKMIGSGIKVNNIGELSKVFLAQNKKSLKYYAVKVMQISVINENKQMEYIKSEKRCLKMCHHPFIIPVYLRNQI